MEDEGIEAKHTAAHKPIGSAVCISLEFLRLPLCVLIYILLNLQGLQSVQEREKNSCLTKTNQFSIPELDTS